MKAYFDTECYPNYWLLKIRPEGTSLSVAYRLLEGQSFIQEQKSLILYWFDNYTVISFNGIRYDVPMITAALMGYAPAQLKELSDRMIVHKVKHWELGLPDWKPRDHIDLIEVAPGEGSLKQFAARIHSKTIRDLPYPEYTWLTHDQMDNVDYYCDTDIDDLIDLDKALQPQIAQRIALSERYGIDLRSKSDAQAAETALRHRCEKVLNRRLYKANIDWSMTFRYEPPEYIAFQEPQLQHALSLVKNAKFTLGKDDSDDVAGNVNAPPELKNLRIKLGSSTYKLGIGGLHSSESSISHYSDDNYVLRDNDVARYYPQLILNSGKFPLALGEAFRQEFQSIADERLVAKREAARLKKAKLTDTPEYLKAKTGDDGGKIMINGTFGKTGSPYSILFAPTMLIQTTITGQLCLLMLIEWHEHYGISVISANTDGIVIKCRRDMLHISEHLIGEWQRRTGLEMETVEYKSIHSRDVNNYFAVKADGEVKRKGEYAISGLVEKKNPDIEICSDAVASYLANGTPLLYAITECRDIRKFITVIKVTGGGTKLWGNGPIKGTKVRDMIAVLQENGWVKEGRNWRGIGGMIAKAKDAYNMCFNPQRPEYLGKVVRWYYSTNAPGPIVRPNGNLVPNSLNSRPVMTLPDEFPDDIDYEFYYQKCLQILVDMGK